MNIFDKAVEIVNPSAALRRTQDRFKLQMIRSFQNSGYDESGASRNKNSMRGWLANSKTPQEDITGRHRQEPSNLAAEIPKSLYVRAPGGVGH